MNWDQIQGKFKELKGQAQAEWGDLTDDEWHSTEGRREKLVGLVQRKYGKAKEVAEREVDDWMRGL